jgi:predicted Zn-dependent protease
MQVRWKPLLILSGVFAATAMAGLGVWVFGFGAGSVENPESILQQARVERDAGQFDRAMIQYRRALQAAGGADPAIHEEMAELAGKALAAAPEEQKGELRISRIRSLAEAARLDRRRIEPRRMLMREALADGEEADALRWAEELIVLDPKDKDANYLLAEKHLDRKAQDLNKARGYVEALAKLEPNSWRVAFSNARLNIESNQADRNVAIFERLGSSKPDANATLQEQVSWVRLKLMQLDSATMQGVTPELVGQLRSDLESLLNHKETPVSYRVEWTRVLQKAARSMPDSPAAKTESAKVDQLVETSLKQAIDSNRTDLRLQLALGQHLIGSARYDACIELVEAALKSPEAKHPGAQRYVYGLRDLAIKSLLAVPDRKDRFELASVHVQALLAAKPVDVQGLGHLFQGAMDLERSGVGERSLEEVAADAPEAPAKTADAPKTPVEYRRSAMNHLRKAAESLPELSTAQALYGVSLILNREPELGRQALQKAWKLGITEVRYQVWMAWSQVMAGYPEDALPIVTDLMNRSEKEASAAAFRPTLHLLLGEIHQARNTPESLRLAYEQYAKALATSKDASSAVHLRVAQLEMLLQQSERADARLTALAKNTETAAAAAQLQVLSLVDKGDLAGARKLLDQARSKHADSPELVNTEAMILLREGKPEDAVRVLADFVAKRPEIVEVVQLQAQIMAERLNRSDDARKMIAQHLAKSPNSALQAQSAQLAIAARDFASARDSIAKIRSQWPNAASADLLTAQLQLAQNNLPGALAGFREALKKDPNNKVAQFWAAQMEARLGAVTSASEMLEKLVSEAPTKRLEAGLSLKDASQAALASLEIDAGQADSAIARLEGIIRDSKTPEIIRDARWQIVAALGSKRDWTRMSSQIDDLLADKSTTLEDRVRAANYLRGAGQADKALAQVDLVLKERPVHAGAAALKAFILADTRKLDEAAAVIAMAIQADDAPVSIALLQAAIENGRGAPETRRARSIAALESSLKRHPESAELIKAIYAMKRGVEARDALLTWVDGVISDKAPLANRRLKAQILANEGESEKADAIYSDLVLQNGQDLSLALERLQAIRSRIQRLNAPGERDAARALAAQLDQLIETYRGKFSDNPEIYALEAEIAAERGQLDRAIEISRKIDTINPTSPLGPLVRVRVLMPRRQWKDVAENLETAIARDPRRRDLRIQLANVRTELGQSTEALRLVSEVLEIEPKQFQASLMKARLLVTTANDMERPARLTEALAVLDGLATSEPDRSEIYEEAASLSFMTQQPNKARAWIERGLTRKVDDPVLVSMLIEAVAAMPDFSKIMAEWKTKAIADESGKLALAISIALQRAGKLNEALEMAELSSSKGDLPGIWLNKGGVLLALAEAETGERKRTRFEESVVAYDKVLKLSPDSIEAVNNKAWILHHHLGRHQSAAEVVDAFMKRTDPSQVPAEFDDTVGSIREAVAQNREAEASFGAGLSKSPSHPMLNFHMGRLLSRDPGRRSNARSFLERALANPNRLDDTAQTEARRILAELDGKPSAETIRAN